MQCSHSRFSRPWQAGMRLGTELRETWGRLADEGWIEEHGRALEERHRPRSGAVAGRLHTFRGSHHALPCPLFCVPVRCLVLPRFPLAAFQRGRVAAHMPCMSLTPRVLSLQDLGGCGR